MVYLRISSPSKEQIEEVASILLTHQLILDVNIKPNIERWNNGPDGQIHKSSIFLLTGKTRANLFPEIEELLRERFKEDMPELYSIPIIHMDWEQAEQLKNGMKKRKLKEVLA